MDIYMERIVELLKNPLNKGEIDDAEIKKTDYNPSCGDMIRVFAKVNEGKIKDIKFQGQGCAISIASASLLTEYVKGKNLEEVEKMGQNEMLEILGLDLSKNPSRIKCAMLALIVLKKGITDLGKS
ncbi:iron-sulfur cluster assembly scaffold protein [Candidatus Micrarchaeota archaeon]|nr:iron-sulfur cluster assembly scaffold protein [Candidatus Micrarchaeota archaeon]